MLAVGRAERIVRHQPDRLRGPPRDGGDPIVFDLATSAIANGDIQIAARNGASLPAGMGVDSQGRATEDPQAILNGGALLPFGGYKGSALSMMVELLAAALTGGHFSFEFDWSKHPGAQTPWTGQLLIVIDPSKGAGQNFAARSQELVTQMHAQASPAYRAPAATANEPKHKSKASTSSPMSWRVCGSWRTHKVQRSVPALDRPGWDQAREGQTQ